MVYTRSQDAMHRFQKEFYFIFLNCIPHICLRMLNAEVMFDWYWIGNYKRNVIYLHYIHHDLVVPYVLLLHAQYIHCTVYNTYNNVCCCCLLLPYWYIRADSFCSRIVCLGRGPRIFISLLVRGWIGRGPPRQQHCIFCMAFQCNAISTIMFRLCKLHMDNGWLENNTASPYTKPPHVIHYLQYVGLCTAFT